MPTMLAIFTSDVLQGMNKDIHRIEEIEYYFYFHFSDFFFCSDTEERTLLFEYNNEHTDKDLRLITKDVSRLTRPFLCKTHKLLCKNILPNLQ